MRMASDRSDPSKLAPAALIALSVAPCRSRPLKSHPRTSTSACVRRGRVGRAEPVVSVQRRRERVRGGSRARARAYLWRAAARHLERVVLPEVPEVREPLHAASVRFVEVWPHLLQVSRKCGAWRGGRECDCRRCRHCGGPRRGRALCARRRSLHGRPCRPRHCPWRCARVSAREHARARARAHSRTRARPRARAAAHARSAAHLAPPPPSRRLVSAPPAHRPPPPRGAASARPRAQSGTHVPPYAAQPRRRMVVRLIQKSTKSDQAFQIAICMLQMNSM